MGPGVIVIAAWSASIDMNSVPKSHVIIEPLNLRNYGAI